MPYAIVCGGRSYPFRQRVFTVLDEAVLKLRLDGIIEGGAGKEDEWGNAIEGADLFARDWALQRHVPLIEVPANWDDFGKSAGPRRNLLMARMQPACCIAFPGRHGTQDMITKAKANGVTVWEVT